ncbi:MAG: hypothetical protein L6Q35_10320 [Phycisphaerales bacterium]|nr:hypothetical protein [Phycisphaerales bacterium]
MVAVIAVAVILAWPSYPGGAVSEPPSPSLSTQLNKWPGAECFLLKRGEAVIGFRVVGPLTKGEFASGPPVAIYSPTGLLVDFTFDSGDDVRFSRAWSDFAREPTTREVALELMQAAPRTAPNSTDQTQSTD